MARVRRSEAGDHDREGYVDHSASKRTGRTVVRGFDDEDNGDAEPDDEDYASVDDTFVAAHARLKHGNWLGMTGGDVAHHLRGALDHEPRSLTNRTVRSTPISNDELLAAAKDAYDRRMDLHARYKSPNKIQGDVQAFIKNAKAKKGMPEHMAWGRIRSALAEHVIPGSPQDVRKRRPKRKRMYHPHLRQGYRSDWHYKAPGVQHDMQHASNANGPWMRLHYGPGGVTGNWHTPGVHEMTSSMSVGSGPATALAPVVDPTKILAPKVPQLVSVRPNWTQANKQRFVPRGRNRQARVVYRGYSPKV